MRISEEEFFGLGMELMGEFMPIKFHTKDYKTAINLARMFCGHTPEKHLMIISQEDGITLAYNRYRKFLRNAE